MKRAGAESVQEVSTRIEEREARDRILLAAARNFSERGYAGARMQEIAEEARINKAMLHYYYRDKDSLYRATLNFFIQEAFERLKNITIQGTDRRSFVEEVIDTFFIMMRERPGLFRILVAEVVTGACILKEIFQEMESSETERERIPRKFLALKIKEMQKKGEIRPDISGMEIVLTLIGSIIGAFLHGMLFCSINEWDEKCVKQFTETRKASIVEILERGLSL